MKRSCISILAFLILPALFIPVHAVLQPGSSTVHRITGEPDPATVRAAIVAFSALPKKERKQKAKAVKEEVRIYRAAMRSGDRPSLTKFWLTVIAILLPPLAIYLFEGEIRKCFWISILLTLLFWIPGVIYVIVIINKDWKKYH